MTDFSGRDHAVSVRGLTRRFGQFVAVDGISFDVAKGEIFGFLGPNGAGKSTTIRMLCGILAATGGAGRVAGFDIRTETEKIKAHIGYMSQKFSLYEDLTVEENIQFYGGIYGVPRDLMDERREWVIAMAGLEQRRGAITRTLSGGWKQRLALGCALLHRPPVLFLDEPTSGVDPIRRRQFWDLIYDLSAKGVTVFVTTHYMDEAESCHRLGMIYQGRLIALGTPAELKSEFMAESVLEIRCDRPMEAIGVLQALEEVREVTLFGRGLHAVVANREAARAKIPEALTRAGIHLTGLDPIAPSLEDVFISLVQSRPPLENDGVPA